jgi:8-oxo-dGTP pyrophosphatase MutT (NUDIX family)
LEWVLPKGHVEPGETAEQAAVREIREETGLHARIVSALGPIEYWFVADGRRVHKTVHHYLLEATGGTLGTEDVEVSEVAWVPLDELVSRLRHASERRLLDHLPDLLREATAT